VRDGSRIGEDAGLSGEFSHLAVGLRIAARDGDRAVRRPLAPAREDLDDPADGFGAVERAAPAPQHLDAVDVLRRELREIVGAERGAVDAHAVDQHQHLIGIGAAYLHRRHRPARAALDDVDPRHLAQRVGDRDHLLLLELLPRDHSDRRRGLDDSLLGPRRGHHERVHVQLRHRFLRAVIRSRRRDPGGDHRRRINCRFSSSIPSG
jgi:hypothetical protein